MARGNDPGEDFNNQWKASRKRGQERAARGEGPWAYDKYLSDGQSQSSQPAQQESCGKATLFLLGLLSAATWLGGDAAGRLL